jgi:hypothetical protein
MPNAKGYRRSLCGNVILLENQQNEHAIGAPDGLKFGGSTLWVEKNEDWTYSGTGKFSL